MSGVFRQSARGLLRVHGKEAVPFLDGLITNDVKRQADATVMLAAFANAQGRLLAIVRVLRNGNDFFIETEAVTREKIFANLSRFIPAGDFFVEDLSGDYSYFEIFGSCTAAFQFLDFGNYPLPGVFIPLEKVSEFRETLAGQGFTELSDEDYELLRIEKGVPKYGVDVDESTIVPEISLENLISYKKGCYTGQEIIARIHFRGHVAKRLTGLVATNDQVDLLPGADLYAEDGKNAGRITSAVRSQKFGRSIALGFVRYDYLAEGKILLCNGHEVAVRQLPFESNETGEAAIV